MTPKEENNPVVRPTHFIGVGASAGGLEALEDFLAPMPDDTGMAFIVVQHLSPDYKSMMAELLSRKTSMRVAQIEDGVKPEANCIYLIPPKKNLQIYHAQLFLTEQLRDTGLYLPIDIFFRSLAVDQGKKAVGVILSGTGSDGTLGIRAIKEHGGMIMVQTCSHAKFDGMPKSAIETGLADYILDADKMSDALVKYVKHPLVVRADDVQKPSREETDFIKILSLIRTQVGEDFSYYKPKTIIRRIERRISVNQMQDVEEYIRLLLRSREECEILAREFLIGVTQFFRDKEAYDFLEEKVIPELFRQPENPIRLWSAGCSTGEEAYSIAMLCLEYMEANKIDANIKVFATDLDKAAVKFAGLACYPESIVADVSMERLQRHFVKKQETYQISDRLRQMVIFSNHNVISDPPFSKINMVACRNLLIYFKPEMQKKVLGLFQYSLADQGCLFLGGSESLTGVSEDFEVIHSKWKIFRHKAGRKITLFPRSRDAGVRVKTAVQARPAPPPADQNLKRHKIQGDLYESVVNHFAPAGVIVDGENMIIHLFKDVQKYLVFPEGKPSYNLIELANPQLSMVLSNMLYKVRKEKTEVTLNKVKFKDQEKETFLNLAASPLSMKKSKETFVVLAIREHETGRPADAGEDDGGFDYDEQASERIRELERELQYRDENLQTTIEELETSNEELQATNEELVSSNEELQSTNEELQSVNEELYTVNSQYQEKIKELTTLNNDVNNLLANTNIGTLFLDSQLTVRKFTPEITKLVNVLDVDVGRPFSHLTFNCDDKSLHQRVNDVLDTLAGDEIEIHAHDGEWYLLRIQPYRHADRSIHGVLLTQINITTLKRAMELNAKLSKAVEQSAGSIVITDTEGRIEYVNRSFSQVTGYAFEEVRGKTPAILNSGRHPKSFYQQLWERIKSGKTWHGEIQNRNKRGDLFWESATISPVKNDQGEITNFLAVKEDITGKKATEEALLRSEEKYRTLFETMTQGVVYQDPEGKIISVNPAAERILGLRRDQLMGLTSRDPRWKSIRENGEAFSGEAHPAMVALKTGKKVENVIMGVYNPKEDRTRWIKISAIPHFRPGEDAPYQVYATLDDVTEQKSAERRLTEKDQEARQRNAKLQSANEMLRQTNQTLTETVKELELSRKKYRMLFNSLAFGFAYHKIITDDAGAPTDYEFITVNQAFEKLTGLKEEDVIGKTVKQALPDTEDFWIETYGRVALEGKTFEFEHYSEALGKHFKVSSYSPERGYFAAVFNEAGGRPHE